MYIASEYRSLAHEYRSLAHGTIPWSGCRPPQTSRTDLSWSNLAVDSCMPCSRGRYGGLGGKLPPQVKLSASRYNIRVIALMHTGTARKNSGGERGRAETYTASTGVDFQCALTGEKTAIRLRLQCTRVKSPRIQQ